MTHSKRAMLYKTRNVKLDKIERVGKMTTFTFSNGYAVSASGKEAIKIMKESADLCHPDTIVTAKW